MKCLGLLLLLIALVGCGPKRDVIGTWHSAQGGVNVVYHFHANGKAETLVDYRGTRVSASGKWETMGAHLRVTLTEAQALNQTPDSELVRSHIVGPSGGDMQWNGSHNLLLHFPDLGPPLSLMKVSDNPDAPFAG